MRRLPRILAGPCRSLLPLFTLVAVAPGRAVAQRATGSMIVRVETVDASPAANVAIELLSRTGRVALTTTSESGLATVMLATADVGRGARVRAVGERCGETWTVVFLAAGAPPAPQGCSRSGGGVFAWGETARILVRLGAEGAQATPSIA